jgi:hypothetical protein
MTLLILTGWAAAAALEWILLVVLHLSSGLPLLVLAAIHITLVIAANAIGIAAAAHVLRRDGYGVSVRSRAAAAWLAPLGVYWTAGSVFAVPLAAYVTYSLAVTIGSFQETGAASHPGTDHGSSPAMFSELPARKLSTALWFFACGACLQAAVATAVVRQIGLAMLLVSGATVIAVCFNDTSRERGAPKQPHRKELSALFTLILALVLTTRGLGSGDRPDGTTVAAKSSGEVNGVFLRPESPVKAIRLVAPPPSLRAGTDFSPRVPIRIPFDGVYWYFRFPEVRPPDDAVTAHGSPEWLRFRSTDETPLIMEAHQHFETEVDLACCSDVDLEIGKTDGDPDPVMLEMFVSDSKVGSRASISLGRQSVAWPAGEHVLHFEIPSVGTTTDFDDLTVRFEMQPRRNTESAKIGIRYLVLIPRGR